MLSRFAWRCSVRAESLSPEVCKTLRKGGCKEVSVGIESGDQRVLNGLKKKTKVEKMKEGCLNAKKEGLNVRALFMIGTPMEREDTPEINRDYIEDLAFDMITLSTFIPLPGTDIWNQASAYNCQVLTKDFAKYNKDCLHRRGSAGV